MTGETIIYGPSSMVKGIGEAGNALTHLRIYTSIYREMESQQNFCILNLL